jgi:glycosyltransferase involved in cell wall biosynthesis
MVYNGIDYYKYASAVPAADVRALGEKIITFVAAFRPQKDQPTLIKAMQYLPEDFHLCLCGGGNDERKALFEVMISELGLQNRVHLLGIRNDIPEVLAASDYVAMSSHFEGLSLASLEGMSSGKPFLASDVDGLHEIVDGNGVLFPHEDAKAFAESILKLDTDDDFKASVIKRCQEKAIQYDINVMAKKYMEIYKKL